MPQTLKFLHKKLEEFIVKQIYEYKQDESMIKDPVQLVQVIFDLLKKTDYLLESIFEVELNF